MNTPTTLESLKDTLEINGGVLFFNLLEDPENHHFFKDKVKIAKNAYFEPDGNTIEWNDDYIINSGANVEGFPFDEIIIDVRLSGNLNEFNSKGFTFSKQAIRFEFTIQAFVFQGNFSVSREN